MYSFTSFVQLARPYAVRALGISLLSVSVFVALIVAESAPLRFTTPTAEAWHCEAMTATPATIEQGQSTTLEWHFSLDSGITVTIEGVGTFDGVSGTASVSPTETTTYTAVAHKVGVTKTLQCSVKVTVTTLPPPPPPPSCDDIVMTIDDTKLAWNNCPHMDSYTVTYCDGTNETVEGNWTTDVTLDLGKRIKEVTARGDSCEKHATQTCPPPPPPPPADPEWPACPFTPSADTIVVEFDGKGLVANGTESDATSNVYNVPLAAGTYTVRTASWDGYSTRADAEVQPYEQWYLRFDDASGEVARTRATTDIADGVIESLRIDNPLESSLVLSKPTTSFTARHDKYPYDSRQSVQPICVAITTQTPPPPPQAPVCTLGLSATSITKGSSATLSWSGTHLASGTIDQGIGAVATTGSMSVAPTNTTTYTGSFTTDTNTTVTCSATLTVRTGGGGGGKCLNCDDDDDDRDKKDDEDEDEDEDDEDDEVTPSIVLAKTITKAGSYITLDQVPYTGFEAGPLATALFWLAVLLVSALIAYGITHYQPFAMLRQAMLASTSRADTATVPNITAYHNGTASAPTATLTRQFVPAIASDDGAGRIESSAHAENILLSPEATRLIMEAIGNAGTETDTFLRELFGRVVATYPREDGWILLSQERATALLNSSTPAPTPAPTPVLSTTHEERPHRVEPQSVSASIQYDTAPATTAPTTATTPARPQGATTAGTPNVDAVVPLFIDLIIAGEQRKAFDLLRRLATQNVTAEAFIMTAIRKLDDVYKNRIEGNHNPDRDLAAKTATWSNADFETVLSILVECVDYSYTSSKVGTKVALAKLFEYFAK